MDWTSSIDTIGGIRLLREISDFSTCKYLIGTFDPPTPPSWLIATCLFDFGEWDGILTCKLNQRLKCGKKFEGILTLWISSFKIEIFSPFLLLTKYNEQLKSRRMNEKF